ncbi:MAG: hypothetical protein WBH04_15305 [Albidovulum sp.]
MLGILLVLLSVPAVVSAFSGERSLRAATVLVVVGGVMILYAMTAGPAGYTAEEIPQAVMRVIARLIGR